MYRSALHKQGMESCKMRNRLMNREMSWLGIKPGFGRVSMERTTGYDVKINIRYAL